MNAPELVVAGNLLVDDIVFHDGRTLMGEPGGGAMYVCLAASLWNVRVGLVSVLGTDYPAAAIAALSARGVDLEGVRRIDGPALRSWLLYEPLGRRIIHQLGTPSHATVSPAIGDFPPRFLGPRLVHVCPQPFDRQRELVSHLAHAGPQISLDPHETVREDNLEVWREVLAHLDLFFVSHEELQLRDAANAPREALRRLVPAHVNRHLLLKRGRTGGLHYDALADRFITWDSRVSSEVVDETGAGDAFAGGVLAGRLRDEPWDRAFRRGVVSASFAIESWGPRALIAATPADAERRLRDWFGA